MKKQAVGTYHIAKICQVAPITVGRWIEEGKLPFFTTGGGHRRVWSSDLIKFLKAHNYPVPKNLKLSAKQSIVVVDDDNASRKLIHRILEKDFPDIEIHEAVNGFQAGELISSKAPSLVILDIFLPGMNGFDVCRHIRANASLKKVKVLAISGDSSKETRDKIIKAGANLFIEKSFKIEAFSKLVRKLLA